MLFLEKVHVYISENDNEENCRPVPVQEQFSNHKLKHIDSLTLWVASLIRKLFGLNMEKYKKYRRILVTKDGCYLNGKNFEMYIPTI